MFKKNTKHQQPALISAASELPEKQRKRLEKSWASTFYREFFNRIDEEAFSVLYSDLYSRPNIPVNVLVGLEALKAGNGWSDEELYENYCYNLQVRYALGYDRLGDGDFEIRTLYYFRERLSRYNVEKGINLLEKAFEQITDKQMTDLKVRSGMQRMDSTQIASNIVSASRLQLLVEAVQRVERILNEVDRARMAETFAPFLKESAGHYTYRVKGKEAVQEHLQKIGQTIHGLLLDLEAEYAAESPYQVLERLFSDNFHLVARSPKGESGLRPKENQELTSDCLQSVDDLEATYRTKGSEHYKGYVANVTETCDPENELQLIIKTQVAPNNVDDATLLEEVLPSLKARTDLDTLYTDGGFGSPKTDQILRETQVVQIQTAIRGRTPSSEKLNLADFEIKQTEKNVPTQITCPQAQTVAVHPSCQKKGYVSHFDLTICQACPFYQKTCPAQPGKRDARPHLNFTEQQVNMSQRRRKSQAHLKDGRNLRAAIESTVRVIKHPFHGGKLPVRGRFRVTCMIIGSAIVTNVRRIQRYLAGKVKSENEQNRDQKAQDCSKKQSSISFLVIIKTTFSAGFRSCGLRKLNIGC